MAGSRRECVGGREPAGLTKARPVRPPAAPSTNGFQSFLVKFKIESGKGSLKRC